METSVTRNVLPLSFDVDDGLGYRARLGMILLETDQTLEVEMRLLSQPGVAVYHSRLEMEVEVSPESLLAMEERLPQAAKLLAAEFKFDAIGYGCTSASTLIGDDVVEAAIQTAHPGVPCTNPILAAIAAFRRLDIDSIAVVTPYTADVTDRIASHFEANGIATTTVASFLEPSDLVVGRISESSIADAVREVNSDAADAVFVSCTSLRSFGILESLEHELDKPVVSSNQAFAWHLHRLGGFDDAIEGFGRLLSL